MAEQRFCKAKVGGSTPLSGSFKGQSSSVAERFLGKKEVEGPIPSFGSELKKGGKRVAFIYRIFFG